MDRLSRFEEHRFVGDKRCQVVHDIDACDGRDIIAELVRSEKFIGFGPDHLAEARNRGYKLCDRCPGVRARHE